MSILLRYQGPSVDDGTMDVYDAAANMVAFSDYVVAAAHKLYGDDVSVKAEVTAFKHASFGTDLQFIVSAAAMILPLVPDVISVASTVKDSIELYRFLRGKAPASVEHQDEHSIKVTNNNGNITYVNGPTYNLTFDPKAGAAAAQFIGDALSKPGVDRIEITSDGSEIAQATKDEASFFRAIGRDDVVTEEVSPMGLVIESLSFKEGTKWRIVERW